MPRRYFASPLTILLRWYIMMTFTQAMLHPRESETRQVKSLDGMWDFRADIFSSGFEEMWYSMPLAQVGDILSMPVPSSYNDITEERWLRDFIGWVWYEKQFYVPPSWLENKKRVTLRFESVFYRCKVMITIKITTVLAREMFSSGCRPRLNHDGEDLRVLLTKSHIAIYPKLD